MFGWPALIFIVIMAIAVLILQWSRIKALATFAETTLAGGAELPCTIKELHKRLLRLLTAENAYFSVRIKDDQPDRIDAELLLVDVTRKSTGRIFNTSLTVFLKDRGESGSAFAWSIDTTPMAARYQRWCMILRMCAVALMVVLGAVMILFVLPAENEGVKAQTLQTIHIGHLLWPPFLLMHRYRFHLQTIDTQLVNRFQNLKYTLDDR